MTEQPNNSEIVGRDAELDAIDAFLAGAADRPGLLVIEGAPGIGKTTLWQAAVDRARDRGHLVLVHRAAESERPLTYAGLFDLLDRVGEEVLADLPEIQRSALEIALLRHPPGPGSLDPRPVMAGLLGALRSLVARGPVLIAVDDLQWVDASSLRALDFALRRLAGGPFGFIASVRPAEIPTEFTSATDDRLVRLRVGGLTVGALHHLLRTRFGSPLSRPALRRLSEATAGNPLHALQLVQAGTGDSEGLESLLRRRVRRLPHGARDLLLLAALASRPTRELVVGAAAEGPSTAAGIELLEKEGLLVDAGPGLRFGHPLFAAAVEAEAPAAVVRDAHARLARRVRDPEERVVHRALAAPRPSATTAAQLEEAAAAADARGAPDGAARLLELAVRLTPAGRPESAHGRRLQAARYRAKAGDNPAAEALLTDLVEGLPPGPERARAQVLLASIRMRTKGPKAARPFAQAALAEAGGDRLLRAEAHLVLSLAEWWDDWHMEEAAAHTEVALELLGDDPPPDLLARALGDKVALDIYTGRSLDAPATERVLELERQAPTAAILERGTFAVADALVFGGDPARARELLAELTAEARRQGDESSLPTLLGVSAFANYSCSAWEAAARELREAIDLIDQVGQHDYLPQLRWLESMVAASRGDIAAAIAAGEDALARADAVDNLADAYYGAAALAFAELSRGDPEAALARQRCARTYAERMGDRRLPSAWEPEEVEVLVLNGRLEEARAMLEEVERRARRAPGWRYRGPALRARGLFEAARGQSDAALDCLRRSAELLRATPDRFNLARSLLAAGQVERRQKHWGAARRNLEEAAAIFESLPAPTWAAQARRDLDRLGGRAASTHELSQTERRVADLAAAGRTTAEIASQLFMAPQTVSANLTRVYQKLGVRSRAELAARVARAD